MLVVSGSPALTFIVLPSEGKHNKKPSSSPETENNKFYSVRTTLVGKVIHSL